MRCNKCIHLLAITGHKPRIVLTLYCSPALLYAFADLVCGDGLGLRGPQ